MGAKTPPVECMPLSISNLFNLEAFQACKQTRSGWNNNEAHDAATETDSEYLTPQSVVDADLLLNRNRDSCYKSDRQ
jgi:hypothetical protein